MSHQSSDPHNLARFVDAQSRDYTTALAELKAGQKRSHWIWYIFPQLRGLGRSETAQYYGIASLDEARAYLAHPTLGQRLSECLAALQVLPNTLTADQVFGQLDAMKLRSSLTLFSIASGDAAFTAALDRWFDGQPDEATLRLLNQ